ncbi:MAG: amidase family protein, partial [Formivibrio sp.]|nr:amidase family protein [Formivibrio sp.]
MSEWQRGAGAAGGETVSSAIDLPADFYTLTGSEAAALISERKITSRALVEGWLARIEAHKDLNAFISVNAEAALRQAQAYDRYLKNGGACLPLGGVPIAVKDNIHVA